MSDEPLVVTERVSIPRHELEARATRSGGPGGQHVNTSSTRIELLWNVAATTALTDEEKVRVRERLATRMDAQGVLRVVSSAHRSQRQNRDTAEERLSELVRRALQVQKRRVATKPTRAAREARLEDKKRQSERKRLRRELE
jgi:ribosome-associated protein